MKVLLINSVCGRQSTGRIVTDIKRELVKQGHECVIAYGEATSIADDDDYHIGSEIERYIHAVFARLFDGMGYGSVLATLSFIKWIEQYDPDVINLHNIHGYYINIVILFRYLKKSRAKIVWTFHDCWPFTGHGALCDAKKCERWKNGCFKCPMKSDYPKSFLDFSRRNYLRKKNLFTGINSMTIVTPSNWLAGLVNESFMGKYEIKVVNNGIDLSCFHPIRSDFKIKNNIQNKTILLGVASVWNDLKGLNDFYKLQKILDDSYALVLVGLNTEQIKKLPNGILGISHTDGVRELSEIYSSADYFLNLTYCDNFPTVNIEALACGTPVITYETGGSAEMIASDCGFVVPQGDIDGVANLIAIDRRRKKNSETISNSVKRLDKSQAAKDYAQLFQRGC